MSFAFTVSILDSCQSKLWMCCISSPPMVLCTVYASNVLYESYESTAVHTERMLHKTGVHLKIKRFALIIFQNIINPHKKPFFSRMHPCAGKVWVFG